LTNSLELAAVATRTAALGEGSGVEAAQFELEAQELAVQRIQLESDRAVLVGSLRPLLGVAAPESIEISGELLPAHVPGETGETSLATRPDYQAALARRESADRALALETGTPPEVAAALRAAGYHEPQGLGELGGRSDFGGAQVVLRDPAGCLIGGSDPRKDGMALAV
ncbi:MAG: hypothetical protein Q8L16_21170, partial [Hydrogenophaga sp.]|nr:hypothetical protein [Hydrogenophaga sp.]